MFILALVVGLTFCQKGGKNGKGSTTTLPPPSVTNTNYVVSNLNSYFDRHVCPSMCSLHGLLLLVVPEKLKEMSC